MLFIRVSAHVQNWTQICKLKDAYLFHLPSLLDSSQFTSSTASSTSKTLSKTFSFQQLYIYICFDICFVEIIYNLLLLSRIFYKCLLDPVDNYAFFYRLDQFSAYFISLRNECGKVNYNYELAYSFFQFIDFVSHILQFCCLVHTHKHHCVIAGLIFFYQYTMNKSVPSNFLWSKIYFVWFVDIASPVFF